MAINLTSNHPFLSDPYNPFFSLYQSRRLCWASKQGGLILGKGSYTWTGDGASMSDKVNEALKPENLLIETYAALARAVDWSVHITDKSKGQYGLYEDLDGVCSRISAFYIIMQNKLHLFRSELYEEIDTHSRKAQWLDKRIKPFCKDLNRFINRYSDVLGSEKNLPPYVLRDLEPIFASCAGCALRFHCLYVFKEVFSVLDPAIIFSSNKDTVLYDIFRTNVENIRKVIDGLFIQKGDIAGWPCSTTHRDDIDVYITASMLNMLLGWQDYLDELHLKHDFSLKSDLFGKCIAAICKLQETNRAKKNRELVGDNIDVSGSWKEFYWGEYLVNRIKATATIARILHKLHGPKETIRLAKAFIDRSFGNAPYCIDLVSYRDTISSTVSDISGTVSALEFYLSLGKDYDVDSRDVNILVKVRWLLDQQRRDGAWPILSKELLFNYQESPYIRDNLRLADGDEKFNKSLPNTIGAMKALTTFLKTYLDE